MKYFISQPMRNKTPEEIKSQRERMIAKIKEKDSNAEIIDSYFENDVPETKHMAVSYLGRSLQKLSEADEAVFTSDYASNRGCNIEHIVATEYGIKTSIID